MKHRRLVAMTTMLAMSAPATLWARPGDDPKAWKDKKDAVLSMIHSDSEETVQKGVKACADANHVPAAETLAYACSNLPKDTPEVLRKWQDYQKAMMEAAGAGGGMGALLQNPQQAQSIMEGRTMIPKVNARLSINVHGADGFAMMTDQEVIDWMCKKGLKYKDWRVAGDIAWALGEIGNQSAVEWLSKLLTQRSAHPVVKGLAAESLGVLGSKESVKDLGAIVEKDGAWQVRLMAAKAISQIDDPRGMEHLINRMSQEDGKMLHDFNAILEDMAGENGYPDAGFWKAWWERNKAAIADGSFAKKARNPDDKPSQDSRSTSSAFYGIPIYSKNIIFLIDTSGSMEAPSEKSDVVVTEGPAGGELNLGTSRLARAKAELIMAIRKLSEDTNFNVIIYSTAVQLMSPTMLKATDKNKVTMEKEIRKLEPGGSTNIFDALELAFDITGTGEFDRMYKVPVDTIYLLSDGDPTDGRIVPSERIMQEIYYWNRYRQITINSIQLGGSGGGGNPFAQFFGGGGGGPQIPGISPAGAPKPLRARDPRSRRQTTRGMGFMERLATENDGEYVNR